MVVVRFSRLWWCSGLLGVLLLFMVLFFCLCGYLVLWCGDVICVYCL